MVICVSALAATDKECGNDGSLNMARRADVVSIYLLRAYDNALVGLFLVLSCEREQNWIRNRKWNAMGCCSTCLDLKSIL